MIVLPGDMVTFDPDRGPDCAKAIGSAPAGEAPKQSYYVSEDEARRLREVWLGRRYIKTGAHYVVVCSSPTRALLMHSSGRLVLVTDTGALVLVLRP